MNFVEVTAFYCLLPTAVAAAVLHLPVACLVGWFYRRTPFSAALNEYHKHIQCKPHLGRDATHPRNQGLMVLTLQDLRKHFERFSILTNEVFVCVFCLCYLCRTMYHHVPYHTHFMLETFQVRFHP